MRSAAVVGLSCSALLLAACASAPAPTTPTPQVASSVPTADTGSDAGTPEPEVEAEPHRPRPPVEVINLCHDVAVLAYGDPPNMKADGLGRFLGDASGSAPRERDGSLPVTLLDDKGNVLAKVLVSRRMKKLEIGRSCRTLYAH